MITELAGSIEQLVYDKNGCHVIQKCIEKTPAKDLRFILEELVGKAHEMSMNKYSCHVIQKVIECCS